MIIFPAIDIQDRKVVRLRQGVFSDVTEYADDPLSVAQKWRQAGARWLHVIDLDGARAGRMRNLDVIGRIAKETGLPVQTGGGVRTREDIGRLFDNGVRRVILGTQAIADRAFLEAVLERWPEGIAVSLDCDRGRVTRAGWTEVTDIAAADFAVQLEQLGLRCLIYTDIHRDGMLSGPNIPALKELLAAVTVPVIASGGIRDIGHIQALRELEPLGLAGAITGKAIYEGTLDLGEALRLCSQNG
jgi:phosphoribosylformimino-5-aminoimidazole carboxamide ribotide isomerase